MVSDSLTVNVYPYPTVPVANNVNACFGLPIPDLTATSTGTVKWYNDIALTNLVHTGTNFTTGQTAIGTYTYYLVQIIHGCSSQTKTVTLTINPVPSAPVSGGNKVVCYGAAVPDLTAAGTDTIHWYSNPSLTTLVHTGSTFSTGQTAVGTYTYYVTQTISNCQSAAAVVTLTIVDLTMKDSHGTELIRELAERYSQLPMLVVSMHDESLYGERAIRAGAKGYITKQEAAGAIRDAIRRVLSGQYHLSDALAAKMIRAAAGRTTATTAELSDRQLVVIRLLGGGMSTTQIALEMKLSIKTVEGYIARIKKKLNVASAGELLKYAIELNKEHGTYPPLCPFG